MSFASTSRSRTDTSATESKTTRKLDNEEISNSKTQSKSSELKRMTINLPADTARMLELLSDLQGISQIEAIRRAISTEAYIQREVKNGSKILVQPPDNQIRELVFR